MQTKIETIAAVSMEKPKPFRFSKQFRYLINMFVLHLQEQQKTSEMDLERIIEAADLIDNYFNGNY